jgi:hypothetical protein
LQKIDALPVQPTANTIELKDIHLPEQISNYPIAYGWWLLASLLVLAIIFSIIKIRKSAKRNQVKKQALARLKNDEEMTISDTIALLKWAAMHYFSRVELARLFGDSLHKFLTAQLPIKHQKSFTDLSEQPFLNQYRDQAKASKGENNQDQIDENINQAAALWLMHALPPKILKVTNENPRISKNKNQGVNA